MKRGITVALLGACITKLPRCLGLAFHILIASVPSMSFLSETCEYSVTQFNTNAYATALCEQHAWLVVSFY